MAQWDNRNVESEATKIAQAYLAADSPSVDLKSLTLKVAQDHRLNQEQIRRLCRAANTKTFEAKFASMKDASDRVVEFDPVDAETVIHALYKDAGAVATKQAAARYPALPNEMQAHRPGPPALPAQEKTAAERWDEVTKGLGKDPAPEVQYRRLLKVSEELSVRTKVAELRWNGAMEDLLASTKRLYWNHDAFEKSALALHGEAVVPELNGLRTERKLGVLALTTEKVAMLQDRLVGSASPETDMVKTAATSREDYLRSVEAKKAVDAKLATLRAQITGHA